jgi:hypothetical protein
MVSETNHSGVRYTILDIIFGVADEISVCSVVLYRRRMRPPVPIRILYWWRICSVRYVANGAFATKRWKVPRCRPSHAARLARRTPRVVTRLAPPDSLVARALVRSLLGGR